ncbi:nuclear transport factor 2 family protein [Acinetobacter qingfengensis]|uniref:SnoaL-like domain-containing protein n=1 Tax=Acinetobacter qingfengensis TaxID=1262585 RepID=A0A1E7R554_9GAMM|nr:nuclear transport factor 2 family protein [Acinetobacter qingfengensis]KAA8732421.1 nuclear transport factor 2 family protein [Acinetobacter qingfengensis]OEY94415.1 hypothetical protein BJI46_03485 [Acinetobacter qingfengensis]
MTHGQHPALMVANEIITAFGQHQTAQYFALFEPEAQFIFYTHHEKLNSRMAYEMLWTQWEEQHRFKILNCESLHQAITLHENIAVFTHEVRTTVQWENAINSINEAETIILKRNAQGLWRAIHEHLSPKATSGL